jgi:stage II sporulation protein M
MAGFFRRLRYRFRYRRRLFPRIPMSKTSISRSSISRASTSRQSISPTSTIPGTPTPRTLTSTIPGAPSPSIPRTSIPPQTTLSIPRPTSISGSPYENVFLVCFFAGVLLGTIIANLLYSALTNQAGYYLGLLGQSTSLGKNEKMDLFIQICRQRIIEVVIIWGVGLTAYAIPCFCLLTGGLGLSMGVVLSVMTGQKGLLGLPVFIMTIIPQIFCYVPVICLLLMWGIRRNGKFRIPALLFLLLLVITGSACETWLNPFFLGFVM